MRDKFTSLPRGFAFVHFNSIADATRALHALQVTCSPAPRPSLRLSPSPLASLFPWLHPSHSHLPHFLPQSSLVRPSVRPSVAVLFPAHSSLRTLVSDPIIPHVLRAPVARLSHTIHCFLPCLSTPCFDLGLHSRTYPPFDLPWPAIHSALAVLACPPCVQPSFRPRSSVHPVPLR